MVDILQSATTKENFESCLIVSFEAQFKVNISHLNDFTLMGHVFIR